MGKDTQFLPYDNESNQASTARPFQPQTTTCKTHPKKTIQALIARIEIRAVASMTELELGIASAPLAGKVRVYTRLAHYGASLGYPCSARFALTNLGVCHSIPPHTSSGWEFPMNRSH